MKIKTRLGINAAISLGTVIFILLAVAWALWAAFITGRNVELVEDMRKVAFERILLRDEYLLYHEERAKRQWFAKSEALRNLIAQADTRFDQEEYSALLQAIRKDFDATFSGFSMVIEEHESRDRARTVQKNSGFIVSESRLISQVLLRAYSLTDNINRLRESVQKKETSLRNRGISIIVFVVLGGITAIISNSTVINRTLTKRITALTNGVEVIGAGNLDHRIAVEGDDELSALALTSNEMATKLKQSYTSVDHLNKEIAERKMAEVELKDALSKVKTLSGMLPICASCKKIRDDQGYWNQLESYIADHSEAEFSHGICPDCAKKLYGKYYDKLYPKGNQGGSSSSSS